MELKRMSYVNVMMLEMNHVKVFCMVHNKVQGPPKFEYIHIDWGWEICIGSRSSR